MRGPFDGVLNIVRFNWPVFLGTGLVAMTMLLSAGGVTSPIARATLLAFAAALTLGTAISLTVSWLIYDRSPLYRFTWLSRALEARAVHTACFCQTGFDETSAIVRTITPQTAWTLLDHYDPAHMTEASIQRARRVCPPAAGTLPAPYETWPVTSDSQDVVIGMLAVHELRHDAERVAWFAESRRVTRADGRIVVVEHVRDLANLLAFGPGALHFHSVATWHHSWQQAGLRQRDTFSVTPWVRVFVLEHV